MIHRTLTRQDFKSIHQTIFGQPEPASETPFKSRFADRRMVFRFKLFTGEPAHKILILSDFINLTQVHNFTVSAQAIFTFRRLSVFTVSFTRILQVVMQKVKRFSTVLLTSQVVLVQSLQPRGPEFESTQDLAFFVVSNPLYSIRLTSLL